MKNEQNYLDNLVGVFGHPVSENPGVVIQEAAFKDLGLKNWRFLTIDVAPEDLEDAVRGLKAFKMHGANTTIPHKIEILKYLDEVAPSAEIIGAVNTIINKDGKLRGENTDGKGFMMALESGDVDPKGKNVVILGAGGAARAISVELALAGTKKITIVNRPEDEKLASSLVDRLREKTKVEVSYVKWESTYNIPEDTDILVNATPIGLYPNMDEKPDIDYDSLKENMYVQDVIPNPAFTPFLKEADKRGIKYQTGLHMLVNQAALNITMWTGKDPNKEVMREALLEALQ